MLRYSLDGLPLWSRRYCVGMNVAWQKGVSNRGKAVIKSLAIAAAIACAAPAAAVSINIGQYAALNDTPFYATSQNFVLPASFTNAWLNVTFLYVDDAAVISINGTPIFATGIFGPGNGYFYFSASGSSVPISFADNGAGGSFTAPFVVGNNVVEVFYNNNNAGINAGNGPLTGGPGELQFLGTISYDVTAVPEPQSWALLVAGFGLVGAAMRRRAAVAA